MTRFINNLPEWNAEDLITLLIDGRKSMDSACASGENSAILSHRQMEFIESLIKKKGGQVPTFEQIFDIEEEWVVLEIKTDLHEDERKNRSIHQFKNREEAVDYLEGFKEFVEVSHGQEAVLNIKHYIKPMNPYRG